MYVQNGVCRCMFVLASGRQSIHVLVVTVYGRMLGLENSYLTCESWVGFERESATGRRQPRFPPTVNLCELCVLICQQHT